MNGFNVTPLHIERGRQMRAVIESDIATRGLSFAAACESLSTFLGITIESVMLAVAIANDADLPAEERILAS